MQLSEERVNILLVDDHLENLLTLDAVLGNLGENLVKAHSGREALRQVLDNDFAVIVLDVQMPDMDGFETAALIRQREQSRHTPIIFLTAIGKDDEQVFRGYTLGAVDYLLKPFVPEVFQSKVAVFVELFKKTRELARSETRLRLLNETLTQQAKVVLESETCLRAVLTHVLDGIVTIDARGLIASFNPAAERIFGYTASEVIDRDMKLLMPESSLGEPNGYASHYREVMGKRKDGSTFPVEIGISSMQVVGQHMFIGIVRDLSERKQLEAQLALARKLEAVGQLAAGIAHEINTPLQYIGDNTRFLRDAFAAVEPVLESTAQLRAASSSGALPPALLTTVAAAVDQADLAYLTAEIPSALAHSLQGLERVSKIVQAMKEFSHPGAAKKVPTDLNHALQTTLTVARNEWKYAAEVVTDFDPALPPVPSLPGEINQVFLNLIVNAAHAIAGSGGSERKGTITLRTRQEGSWVAVRISDTGPGIAEAIRGRIFDPFFTTKEVGQGTGQGLAIAHAVVVDKHGGTLSVETEVGQGTTFEIRLPLTPSPPPQEDPSAPAHPR